MAKCRRLFGPLLYGTIALGLLEVLILGGLRVWPGVRDRWEAHRLGGLLVGPDASTRKVAADGLVNLGPLGWPAMVAAMRSPNNSVRTEAAFALLRTHPDPAASVPAFLRLLRDPVALNRELAALGLSEARLLDDGRSGVAWPEVVEALRAALGDRVPSVRRTVAIALGNLGPVAQAARASLVAPGDDPDESVRLAASAALLAIGGPEDPAAREILLNLMGWPQPLRAGVRLGATMRFLSAYPGSEDRAVEALVGCLNTQDEMVRRESVACLAEVRERASAAVPSMLRVLGRSMPGTRVEIAWAVRQIDRDSESRVVPAMLLVRFDPRTSAQDRYLATEWLETVAEDPRHRVLKWSLSTLDQARREFQGLDWLFSALVQAHRELKAQRMLGSMDLRDE